MPSEFRPARMGGTSHFGIRSLPIKAAESWKKGALLLVDTGTGKIAECGSDPTAIAGVAVNAAFSGPGISLADSADVVAVMPADSSEPIGTGQFAQATDNMIFIGQLYSGSNTLATVAQTDVGNSYGVTKLLDGTWVVDKAKLTTSARVIIDGTDTDLNVVFFKVLAAYIQL